MHQINEQKVTKAWSLMRQTMDRTPTSQWSIPLFKHMWELIPSGMHEHMWGQWFGLIHQKVKHKDVVDPDFLCWAWSSAPVRNQLSSLTQVAQWPISVLDVWLEQQSVRVQHGKPHWIPVLHTLMLDILNQETPSSKVQAYLALWSKWLPSFIAKSSSEHIHLFQYELHDAYAYHADRIHHDVFNLWIEHWVQHTTPEKRLDWIMVYAPKVFWAEQGQHLSGLFEQYTHDFTGMQRHQVWNLWAHTLGKTPEQLDVWTRDWPEPLNRQERKRLQAQDHLTPHQTWTLEHLVTQDEQRRLERLVHLQTALELQDKQPKPHMKSRL